MPSHYGEIRVISGETLFEAIRTRTDRVNLHELIVHPVQRNIVEIKNIIDKILSHHISSNGWKKNKMLLKSSENILCFAIYYTLNSR